jgi:hypothetical protein
LCSRIRPPPPTPTCEAGAQRCLGRAAPSSPSWPRHPLRLLPLPLPCPTPDPNCCLGPPGTCLCRCAFHNLKSSVFNQRFQDFDAHMVAKKGRVTRRKQQGHARRKRTPPPTPPPKCFSLFSRPSAPRVRILSLDEPDESSAGLLLSLENPHEQAETAEDVSDNMDIDSVPNTNVGGGPAEVARRIIGTT